MQTRRADKDATSGVEVEHKGGHEGQCQTHDQGELVVCSQKKEEMKNRGDLIKSTRYYIGSHDQGTLIKATRHYRGTHDQVA